MKTVHHVPAQVFTMCPVRTSRQRNVPQRKATPLPVSPSPGGRGGSLRCSKLGCAAELAAFFELRSNSCGKLDNDARVLRHALTPASALLGTVRRGWERAPHGPLLRSACGPSLRSARQSARASCVGSAERVTGTWRSCESSSRVVPAPHPCWLRREAQGLGWVRVPKDTRTSCSSLPMLFERSSKNAASSSAPPQDRASQVAPLRPTGRKGDADWGPPSLW